MIGPVAALQRPLRFPHLETVAEAREEFVLHAVTCHGFLWKGVVEACPTCMGLLAHWRELRDTLP